MNEARTAGDTQARQPILNALQRAADAAVAPTIERLHRELGQRAASVGALDVAYRLFDSPLGTLLLAATGRGLVRVAYPIEDHEQVLVALAAAISPRLLHAPRRLDEAAGQLEEYFCLRRRRFELALDLQLAHGFRRAVLSHLAAVPYGRTVSYAALALAAGSPRAMRAVGSACATNPLPIVVPCHRVLRSDGSLGGYGGGIDAKMRLLALESEGGSLGGCC